MKELTVILALLLAAATYSLAAVTDAAVGGFTVTHELVLPATPEKVYDTITGDISGWWDHTMSKNPKALYIEPRPGGGFYEIFDDAGDGVLHATVTYAERGKKLRFVGPLGLAGAAIELSVTYELAPGEAGTVLKVTCNAAGQIEEGWPAAVDGVWHHFLVERLKPFMEAAVK